MQWSLVHSWDGQVSGDGGGRQRATDPGSETRHEPCSWPFPLGSQSQDTALSRVF